MHCAHLWDCSALWSHLRRLGANEIDCRGGWELTRLTEGAPGDVVGQQQAVTSLEELPPFWPQLRSLESSSNSICLGFSQPAAGEKWKFSGTDVSSESGKGGPQGRLLTSAHVYILWLGMRLFCLLVGKVPHPFPSACSVARPSLEVPLDTDVPQRIGVEQLARAWRLYHHAVWPCKGGFVGRFSEDTPGDRKSCCQRPHPKCHWDLSEYYVLVQM